MSHILQQGTVLDKRYEIKKMLKAGGMGAVYKAADRRFSNSPCAVKEMLDKSSDEEKKKYYIKRFGEEAKILHRLRHPNLPVVKDYFIENGRYYLVMDYIEGRDLKSIIKDYKGSIPEKPVIKWSTDILEALEYLHSQEPPIIYRDIKPANIMLRDSDLRILLIDFGIARTFIPEDFSEMTAVGTPNYAPEELFEGRYDTRTDIYSLGATMHHMLTGVKPVMGENLRPVREVNPQISQELEEIVMKALSKNPEDRYASAGEMREKLEKLKDFTEEITVIPEINTEKVKEYKFESFNPENDTLTQENKAKKGSLKYILISLGLFLPVFFIILFFILAGGITYWYINDPSTDPTPEATPFFQPTQEPVYSPTPEPNYGTTPRPVASPTPVPPVKEERKFDSIYFENKIDERIWLLVHYNSGGEWIDKGWLCIEPGEIVYAFDTENRNFYYYAESTRWVWEGDKKNEDDFSINYDGKNCLLKMYTTGKEYGDYTITFK